jgi:hypothetical protein
MKVVIKPASIDDLEAAHEAISLIIVKIGEDVLLIFPPNTNELVGKLHDIVTGPPC